MFTCKESVNLLAQYLDGELEPAEQANLHEHLAECPPCVDFLRTYEATPELCRKALSAKMPAELAWKLTDFLRRKVNK